MQYTATDSRHIEIINERQRPAGRLDYPSWFSGSAKITAADGRVYDIFHYGFWDQKVIISLNGNTIAELKYNLGGRFTFSFVNGRSFLFRRKSIWGGGFRILDETDNGFAAIWTVFKWRSLSFDIEADIDETKLDRETAALFPGLLIYCLRDVRKRGSNIH